MKNGFLIRSLSFSLFLIAVFSFAGCKSVPLSIADFDPVIVVSVVGNPALVWKENANSIKAAQQNADDVDDGNGVLSNAINKLVGGDNPEILTGKDRIDYAAQAIHDLCEQTGGISVVEQDQVAQSKTYKSTIESVFNLLDSSTAASGYKNIPGIGSKRARMIMQDNNAKGMIDAQFFFQKENVTGNHWTGEVRALVTMKVRLLNEAGKEVLNTDYVASSPINIPIKKRKYDKQALVDTYPATIDAVVNQFIVSIIQ